MLRTTSISELRDNLADYIDDLKQKGPVMVVRHSKPAGYLLAPEEFEFFLQCLEDYEDLRDALKARELIQNGESTSPAEEVLNSLEL